MSQILTFVLLAILGVVMILIPRILRRRAYKLLKENDTFEVETCHDDPFESPIRKTYEILGKKNGWIIYQVHLHDNTIPPSPKSIKWNDFLLLHFEDADQIIEQILKRNKHEKSISKNN